MRNVRRKVPQMCWEISKWMIFGQHDIEFDFPLFCFSNHSFSLPRTHISWILCDVTMVHNSLFLWNVSFRHHLAYVRIFFLSPPPDKFYSFHSNFFLNALHSMVLIYETGFRNGCQMCFCNFLLVSIISGVFYMAYIQNSWVFWALYITHSFNVCDESSL